MLEIKNLSVRFGENSQCVVEKVNVTVNKNSKTIIIGETGSGKSVLMMAVLRLLPYNAIISGSAILDGTELLTGPVEKMYSLRGKQIGYIPQSNGTSLNPLLKIGRQLDEAIKLNFSGSSQERKKKILSLLSEFELSNPEKIYKSYPHQISGGMRQRVLIAMGLLTGADYIFADEPTKGIDAGRVSIIINKFRKIQDSALLCVTHDLDFAKAVGKNIVVMYAAQQVECCTADEFFSDPLHPYSRALLMALPQNGAKVTMGFAPPHDEFEIVGCRFYERCTSRCERCRQTPPMVKIGTREVRCWKYAD